MGKLEMFRISLDNPQAAFYCGQIIYGHVSVTLNQPMKMRGIRLKLEGKANVQWTETDTSKGGKNYHTTTDHYIADETYFEHILVLYGEEPHQDGNNPTHPLGTYTYHFQYQLPMGCPSSFEGNVGKVRYKMTAVIDKPWKSDHKCVMAYTVLNPLDLNRDPYSVMTPTSSDTKMICCLCCASGPINVTVRLNRGGFVPGEAILISAEIENGSNRDMNCSYAELIQTITFHARTKPNDEVRVVTKVKHDPIDSGATDVWLDVPLAVPALPPSRLDGCSIIDITYTVKFVVEPSGPAPCLNVPLRVLIGSIPLLSVMGLPHTIQPASRPFVSGPEPSAPPGDSTPYPGFRHPRTPSVCSVA